MKSHTVKVLWGSSKDIGTVKSILTIRNPSIKFSWEEQASDLSKPKSYAELCELYSDRYRNTSARCILITDFAPAKTHVEYNEKIDLFIVSLHGVRAFNSSVVAAVLLGIVFCDESTQEIENFLSKNLLAQCNPSQIPARISLAVDSTKGYTLPTGFVLLSHGIRTHGLWMTELSEHFKASLHYDSLEKRYARVDLLKFLFGEGNRHKLAIDLLVKLQKSSLLASKAGSPIDVIFHSYGTSLFGLALEIAHQTGIALHIRSVVLCGSILPRDFNWDRFVGVYNSEADQHVTIDRVLNVCGDSDFFPILARTVNKSFGDSGTNFFHTNSVSVKNVRLQNCGHSDMLRLENAVGVLDSFVIEGVVDTSHCNDVTTVVSLLDSITPYWLVIVIAIVLVIIIVPHPLFSWGMADALDRIYYPLVHYINMLLDQF